MIVWINGAFGSGKTTPVDALRPLRPEWLVHDPETVGHVADRVLARVDATVPGGPGIPGVSRGSRVLKPS
ncbi:hypothetical protein ACLVWQ_07150 [Streptomyces sp. CWNU-52B]|uniref:hypothetical protein n=1 Tax=unclassified Streptomyces TaxID=2593676 RepID=UPI0039BFA696